MIRKMGKLTKARAEHFVRQSNEMGMQRTISVNGMTYESYNLWMQDTREHGVTPENVRRR